MQVNGIILVLSCQKHVNTRLKQCKLSKDNYGGWKVIYVLGDLFLKEEYVMNNNVMTIRCEDSYIHLLKKLVLALKYVYELYDIKEGVLRCGDDLIFNEKLLQLYLNSSKYDFMGKSPSRQCLLNRDITPELLQRTREDTMMVEYYAKHPEDFDNPHHNLKGVNINNYTKRPEIKIGPSGIIYYISNRCCKLLISHMESIHYNIFHFDDFSQSYPYTIEDCAVSYILYFYHISFYHNEYMYTHDPRAISICLHTNLYK